MPTTKALELSQFSSGLIVDEATDIATLGVQVGIDELKIGSTTVIDSSRNATFTGFTSTGIDDNATATAITINSDGSVAFGAATAGTSLEVGAAGGYGSVTTTQYASIFAKAIGANATSLMQVKGNDGTVGMGMRAVTGGTSLIYSNGQLDFRVGSTIRDLDTPSGGTTFMTLSTTGVLALSSTVASTTTTTGALTVAGGVGIAGALNVGGNLNVTGTVSGVTATHVGLANVTNESKSTMFTDPSFTGNTTLEGELRGPATFTIDPAAVGDNTGTVVIKGNLQVDGTTTTINSTTLAVADKNIVLASGAANAAAADGAGITVDGASATLLYNSTPDAWQFNKNVDITSTTASSSTTTGALTVAGGVGIAGALNVNTSVTSPIYTAISNAAGAGTTLNILGSTGTGAAGATGGNGVIQIIGGGGTSTWATFNATFGRRRGGILLQAGRAAGDAGATYYSGSAINILGSSATNNGTSTGTGSQILLTAGGAVAPTGTNSGGTINLNISSGTSGGNVNISAGFGGATSANGGSASLSGGGSNTGTGGTLSLSGGGSSNGAGGPVNIQAGLSIGVAGANVSIASGSGTTPGKIGFTIGALGEIALFNPDGNLELKQKLAVGYSDFTNIPANGAAFLGSVGIGTASPNGKLHVGLIGMTNTATSTIVNMTDFGITSRAGFDGLANNNDGVYFGTGINGGISAGMGFFREASGWNSALAFYTNNVTDGVNVSKMQEKMRITSGGNVGIGTSSPNYKLQVAGSIGLLAAGQSRLLATQGQWGYSSGYRTIILGSTSSTYTTDTTGAVTLAFGVDVSANPSGSFSGDGGELLFRNVARFTTPNSDNTGYLNPLTLYNGSVGIGITTPSEKLEVYGAIKAANSITIGSNGTYAEGSIYSDSSWGMIFRAKQASPANADFRWANSADAEHMRVATNGNLGIGESNPTSKLFVTSAASTIATFNSTNTLGGGIRTQNAGATNFLITTHAALNGTGTNYSPCLFAENTYSLYFATGGSATTRMIINDIGNVGIGTTEPEARLTVIKDLTSGGDATGFRLNANSTADRNILFGGPSTSLDASFWQSYKEATVGAGTRNLLLQPIGGNVGIGTINPLVKLDVVGTIRSSSVSVTTDSTITPTSDSTNQYNITALASAATVAAPSGTPIDGQKLMIRILDNGTPQAITWNATYTVIGATLPTTTIANKMIYVGCIYNATNTRWDVVAVTTQA